MKTKLDFFNAYCAALAIAHVDNEYYWPIANVPFVAEKMCVAIGNNSYNLDSPALKSVMKSQKVPYNRKAIAEFYSGLV